jgi:hypothetical protein
MNRLQQISNLLAVLGLLAFSSEALAGRSYSSGGGHSYSSHSSSSHSSSYGGSHSFSSGSSRSSSSSSHSSGSGSGSKSFTSSSGKSYGSSSQSNNDGRHSYTANKSYSSGPSHSFGPNDGRGSPTPPAQPARNSRPNNPSSDFTFDTAAARARKEQASKEQFTKYKENQAADSARPAAGSPSYSVKPPPIRTSDNYYHRTVYVPDTVVFRDRPRRIYTVFSPYWYRPVVYYNDPYNSFFWWWLLDRSIDDQAWWAYHHRYDMDPARYDALLARDQHLEARVAQLETQQAPRDPNYVPQGLDRDLMYSDQYVNQAYHNRTTTSGTVAFWLFGLPTAVLVCAFFIWLIWFKRWQTATT